MNAGKTGFAPTARDVRLAPDTSLAIRANIVLQTSEGILEGVAEAMHGVITLRGRARTSAERARAGLAVANIDGAQGVRNLLQLVEEPGPAHQIEDAPSPQPDSITGSPADEILKERVEAALKSEPNSDLHAVKVLGVNQGVVHMSGEGVTMTGRLRAVEVAWNAAESVPDERTNTDTQNTNNETITVAHKGEKQ
jgi:osmotically-inducible protein OsmY